MKSAFLVITFLICTHMVWAQREVPEDYKPPFKERVYLGGNFGLNFGSLTYVEVSPLAGYMATNRFSFGPSITYRYFKDKRFIPSISTSIYGAGVFGRYNLTDWLYAYTEYESINVEYYNRAESAYIRDWVPGYFIGGGIFQSIGGRAGLGVTLLFNLLHDDERSPYANNVIIRAGITL